MKRFAVTVTLPELDADAGLQNTRVSAGDARVAINKALKEIFTRDGVEGKTIRRGTIHFVLVAGIDESDPDPEDEPEDIMKNLAEGSERVDKAKHGG